MVWKFVGFLVVAVFLLAAGPARAGLGDCGQPASQGDQPTATDALFTLRASIAAETCSVFVCDVNDSGSVTASDALLILRRAIDQNVVLMCPVSSSTTTTLALGEFWKADVTVDLGGEFAVTADVIFHFNADAFTADVTTLLIAGAPEEHRILISGTRSGDTLTVTDAQFMIVVGPEGMAVAETIELDGTFTIDGDNLSGTGSFNTTPEGGGSFPGTLSATATRV
jgi:hypothetical protein